MSARMLMIRLCAAALLCACSAAIPPSVARQPESITDRTDGRSASTGALCGIARYVPGGTVRLALEEKLFETKADVDVGAFCIDRTEVSIGDYVQCVLGGTCRQVSPLAIPPDPPPFPGMYSGVTPMSCKIDLSESRWEHPVVCVSYFDAETFCAFRHGKVVSQTQQMRAMAGAAGCDPRTEKPMDTSRLALAVPAVDHDSAEVGTHPGDRSTFGVMDLLGNVQEWTTPRNGLNRFGGRSIVSPSATVFGALEATSAERDRFTFIATYVVPEMRRNNLGFRCAYDASAVVAGLKRRSTDAPEH
ncbi:hypothetical protein BH09MYX1_BH09MYX1_18510 [soil metagenome]